MNIRSNTSIFPHQLFATLMLVSFLAIALFSFAVMKHDMSGAMQNDCPFSAVGSPLCSQSVGNAIIHHISAYQSLFATGVGSSITLVMIALLFAMFAASLLSTGPPLLNPSAHRRHFYNFSSAGPRDRKEVRWLSLLENSPSTA